jgi:hypothetical protein
MALLLTGTANAQYLPSDRLAGEVPTYSVGGIALGSRVKLDSAISREYKCGPSEQFAGLTWCQKTLRSSEQHHPSEAAYYSILHSKDGTVLYANRYQQPAFFDAHKTDQDIKSYSRKFGGSPQITRIPHRSRTSDAIMATWGKVELQPLDSDDVKLLAEGKSPKKGLLIDFLGNFARSAQEGLPIYRIIGGAGFVRASSFDQKGRGTVRVAVVDASTFQPNLGLLSAQLPTGPQNDDQRSLVNQRELAAATKTRNDTEAGFAAAIKARRDVEAAFERPQAELSTAINEKTEAEAANKQVGNLMAVSGASQSYVNATVFIWISAAAILLFVIWVMPRLRHASPKHSVDAGRTDADLTNADLEIRHDCADGALVQLPTASESSAETEPGIDQGDLVNRGAIPAGIAVPTVEQSGVPALGCIRQHADPVQSCVDEVETERARAAKVDSYDLQLAIDPTTKEIVIQDLLRLGDADSRLVQELHNIYQEDLLAGRTPENHQYLTSHKLADSLKLAERTVRQRVSRCRVTLRESYKQRFGQDPPRHLLIQNKARQGYRLNPHIRFVAIAELEQSVSASHKPAQAEPIGIS